MLNKRQAVIGYVAYRAGKPLVKRLARRTARTVVPSRIPRTPAILAGIGAIIGGFLFWRHRKAKHRDFFES